MKVSWIHINEFRIRFAITTELMSWERKRKKYEKKKWKFMHEKKLWCLAFDQNRCWLRIMGMKMTINTFKTHFTEMLAVYSVMVLHLVVQLVLVISWIKPEQCCTKTVDSSSSICKRVQQVYYCTVLHSSNS